MIVYIDESGDLGWKFDLPYRAGGSSRYLTISMLLLPNELSKYPKRIIRSVYEKFHIPVKKELKGNSLTHAQLDYFIPKVIQLLSQHEQIKIYTITVNKVNVIARIRRDPNKLYNYMVGLVLVDLVFQEPSIVLIPDPREVKVKTGNSLVDYLQMKFIEKGTYVEIDYKTVPSDNSLNIKFIDFIAHIIWCKFEDGNSHFADQLKPYIHSRKLYFNP